MNTETRSRSSSVFSVLSSATAFSRSRCTVVRVVA